MQKLVEGKTSHDYGLKVKVNDVEKKKKKTLHCVNRGDGHEVHTLVERRTGAVACTGKQAGKG